MATTDTRTCAFPGDQEHDHAMCEDAVIDAAAAELARQQAAGLRALADMIEQHPHIAKELSYPLKRIDHPLLSKEDLVDFVRAVAATGIRVEKQIDGRYYEAVARFGPAVVVTASADREQVCERVVTGTETVTKTVPDPAALAAVPTVEVTEEVEQVEWVCRPLLADEGQAVSRG